MTTRRTRNRIWRRLRPLSAVPPRNARPASQEDLRAILNALPAMVGYWDRNQRNRMANTAYLDYFGLTPEQMRGMHIEDVLGPELYVLNLPFIVQALAGEPQLFDRAIPGRSGTTRYTQASYIPDVADGTVRGFFVLVTDITARHLAEQRREAAERRFRTLFESAPIGTFLLSADGVIRDVNAAAVELFARPREALIGRAPAAFTHPDDIEASRHRLDDLIAGRVDAYRIEKRYLRGDESILWAQLDVRQLRDSEDGTVEVLAQVQDISAHLRQYEDLKRLATSDSLTGLRNRRALLEALDRACRQVHVDGDTTTLLIIDLDHFKELNDHLGHQAGDAALARTARLLHSRLRATDVVARYGGDEFVVILPRTTEAEAAAISNHLCDIIRQAQLGTVDHPISISIGMTRLEPGDTPAHAIERADRAMYTVKKRGGDAVADAA